MVTVKKADGTVVRMTLGELQALKKNPEAVAATPAPVVATPATPLASASRGVEVEAIMKQVGKLASPDNQNRFRSIIQLYLKDVRSRAETENALGRPVAEGGLGLNDEQKEQVLQLADGHGSTAAKTAASAFTIAAKNIVVPDLEIGGSVTPPPKKTLEPAIVQAAKFPAISTPFNAFKHPTHQPSAVLPKKTSKEFDALMGSATTAAPLEIKDLIALKKEGVPLKNPPPSPAPVMTRSAPRQPRPLEAPLKLGSQPVVKPLVRDVAQVTLEVGPVDEIARFNLTDFRRLAANPTEAAKRLQEKFTNLRDESIVLYLQALHAWQTSPLYLAYMEALTQGLAEHRPLSAVLVDKNKIQIAEINALISMEKELT